MGHDPNQQSGRTGAPLSEIQTETPGTKCQQLHADVESDVQATAAHELDTLRADPAVGGAGNSGGLKMKHILQQLVS